MRTIPGGPGASSEMPPAPYPGDRRMLFADAENAGWYAFALAAIGAIGLLVERFYKAKAGAAVTVSDAERKARREDAAADSRRENLIIKELKELVEVQREDNAQNRQEIHDLRGDLQAMSMRVAACEAERAVLIERVGSLEESLEDAGIPHRKYRAPGDGSVPHRPLPRGHRPNPPEGGE